MLTRASPNRGQDPNKGKSCTRTRNLINLEVHGIDVDGYSGITQICDAAPLSSSNLWDSLGHDLIDVVVVTALLPLRGGRGFGSALGLCHVFYSWLS